MALLLTGCSARTGDHPPRIYPRDLVSELHSLKQKNGLFSEPNVAQSAPLSLYSTALYVKAGALSGGIRPDNSRIDASEATAVTPTLFTWAYVTDLGATRENRAKLPALTGLTTSLPEPSDDASDPDGIGLLWAWADTVTRLDPAPSEQDVSAALHRLNSVDAGKLDSPYLLWRLTSALRLLGETQSPAIAAAASQARLPAGVESVPDALNTQGYLELTASNGPKPGSDPRLAARLREALRRAAPDDDLTRATLLRSLDLVGAKDGSGAAALTQRRDPATGLLRQAVTVTGTIDASYLVARLIPEDFAEIAGDDTRQALRHYLSAQTGGPPLDRLRAIAALRLSGDPGWTDYDAEVAAAASGLSDATVTADSLESVIPLIDALRVISGKVPQPTLRQFAVTDDHSDYRARLALANHDMFANSSQIPGWFPAMGSGLQAQLAQPREPLRLYYAGLAALPAAQNVDLNDAASRRVAAGLAALRGCTGFPDLYRSSLSDRSACGLDATLMAIASSFAYPQKADK